jgi:signal transduction histidine kinase
LATASPFDAALRDVLDALHNATRELDGAAEQGEVCDRSAALALRLTRAGSAVVALGSPERGFDRLSSATADPARRLSERAAADLLAAAGFGRAGGRVRGAVMGAELRAHGQVLGAVAVSRPADFSDTERAALDVLAAHVSLALTVAARWDDRAESVARVERAHEQAVAVLESVSSHAVQGQDLEDFYRRLARTVGEHVGAGRVLFWRLGEDGMLAPVPGGYRIDQTMLSRLKPTRCSPGGDDLASRVVFDDFVFRANRDDEPPEYAYVLEILGVASAISVPWRAGDVRLGLVAAYDSTRPGGFSREDTWVLQKAGLAAGLVTRLWHTQDDLRRSVDRLTKVDGARQMLLKNMTTVVEKERKRFVSELHDDALQKLTAAELQVERMHTGAAVDDAALQRLRTLLDETETALRRLVFDVRPPSLERPDGLAQSIRERVAMLTSQGIEASVDLEVPAEMSMDLRTMAFRQLGEAIGNVERHSHATRIEVSLKVVDGGMLGVVSDNGQGFVVSERSNLPGHLGLLALRERSLMAGGRYNIESRPGAGTHVEFWIPLDQ